MKTCAKGLIALIVCGMFIGTSCDKVEASEFVDLTIDSIETENLSRRHRHQPPPPPRHGHHSPFDYYAPPPPQRFREPLPPPEPPRHGDRFRKPPTRW